MGSEERLTEKKMAAEILPKITDVRRVLTAHLASLQYLWEKVDKKGPEHMSMDGFALFLIEAKLKQIEDDLCRI